MALSADLRERLHRQLEQLSDDQAQALLHYTELLLAHPLAVLKPVVDYDPDHDPAIGLFAGSPDLSEQVKTILQDEIQRESGWTQKKS